MIEHTNDYKRVVTMLRYDLLERVGLSHDLEATRLLSSQNEAVSLLFSVLKGLIKGKYTEQTEQACCEFFQRLSPVHDTKDLTDLCVEVILQDALYCEWAVDYEKYIRT